MFLKNLKKIEGKKKHLKIKIKVNHQTKNLIRIYIQFKKINKMKKD